MINVNNYFESSKGAFRAMTDEFVRKYTGRIHVEHQEYWDDEEGRYRTLATVIAPETIVFNNKTWRLNFKSYCYRYDSLSVYYTNEEQTELIRFSDHWSTAESKSVKQVGWIRRCWWELECDDVRPFNGLTAGWTKFANLTEAENP